MNDSRKEVGLVEKIRRKDFILTDHEDYALHVLLFNASYDTFNIQREGC